MMFRMCLPISICEYIEILYLLKGYFLASIGQVLSFYSVENYREENHTSYTSVKSSRAGVKGHRVKGKRKTFKGGCTEEPVSPINGYLTCSSDRYVSTQAQVLEIYIIIIKYICVKTICDTARNSPNCLL